MTPEDKQLISEYMGWAVYYKDDNPETNQITGFGYTDDDNHPDYEVNFDSNDASLCVEKMVEKGDWAKFWKDTYNDYQGVPTSLNKYTAWLFNPTEGSLLCRWLFNPDNFFSAMASWLRSKK